MGKIIFLKFIYYLGVCVVAVEDFKSRDINI